MQLKSATDIDHLAQGGRFLAEVLAELVRMVGPGVVPRDLDARAQELIGERECRPAFLNYAPDGHEPFPAALCVSVNEALVHGLPNEHPLEEGDIVGLDLGLIYRNRYFLDAARTVGVGNISAEADQLMQVTREALVRGIAAAQPGGHVGDIGAAIQAHVEHYGYGVVRQLVGHGVGFAVHEEPKVPNYGTVGEGMKLKPGLVIAIEPMVTVGDPAVETGADGWTVVSADGSLTAQEEHTVAITPDGPRVLTRL